MMSFFSLDLNPSQSAVIYVGDSITLDCDPANEFMTYAWSREGTILMPWGSGANLTITYNNKSSPDTIGGDYTCTAINGTNNVSQDQYFYVGLAPHIILPPTDIQAPIGSDVTLSCEAVGLPTPASISWERESGTPLSGTFTIVNTANGPYTMLSSLTISSFSPDNCDTYKCIISPGTFSSANVDTSSLVASTLTESATLTGKKSFSYH